MAIKNLTNKTITQHEIIRKDMQFLEQSLSRKMEDHVHNLAREVNTTGTQVSILLNDLRKITNLEDAVEELNKECEDRIPVVVSRIEAPQTYLDRIHEQDPLKMDGYMKREEVIFLIENFHDSTKVHEGWLQLLKRTRDPITFLWVLFEQFTFDGRITAAEWTDPELIDDPTGK